MVDGSGTTGTAGQVPVGVSSEEGSEQTKIMKGRGVGSCRRRLYCAKEKL